ncbi:hypothetical protein METSCH_F04450 [Metschnikowia aff. pulcherrima]|uniref:Uncharacterized protein n=1 Tax=Metschnikowia aff. pulcherrima TaxID=2163413 RepID=A0A4P6XTC8_9ASCO|nr:hypothetical protein METSCH_F04450 [Metschnikowia aff. pulcherrima]
MNTWSALVEFLRGLPFLIREHNRRILKRLYLRVHACSIDSEAIDTLLEPETQSRFVNSVSALLALPVKVGLRACKHMQVVLICFLVVFPSRLGEVRDPVVGRLPVALLVVASWFPNVPVTLWVSLGRTRFLKPFMRRQRVVDDQVQDQAHATSMHLFDQNVHILHSAVFWVHALVVGDIVPHIVLGRVKHRQQPDHINTQVFHVIQGGDNSWNIANTVTVQVLIGSRPDLIHGGIFPPDIVRRHRIMGCKLERASSRVTGRVENARLNSLSFFF